jgi:hypothetical protein
MGLRKTEFSYFFLDFAGVVSTGGGGGDGDGT